MKTSFPTTVPASFSTVRNSPEFSPEDAKKAAAAKEAAQAAAVRARIQSMAEQMVSAVLAGLPAASAAGKHTYSLDVKTTLHESNWRTIESVAATAQALLRAKGWDAYDGGWGGSVSVRW